MTYFSTYSMHLYFIRRIVQGRGGGGGGGGVPLVRFTDPVTNHGCQNFILVSSHIISMLSIFFFFSLVVRVSEKQLEKGILIIKEY